MAQWFEGFCQVHGASALKAAAAAAPTPVAPPPANTGREVLRGFRKKHKPRKATRGGTVLVRRSHTDKCRQRSSAGVDGVCQGVCAAAS